MLNEKRIDALDLCIMMHQELLKELEELIEKLGDFIHLALRSRLIEKKQPNVLFKFYEEL